MTRETGRGRVDGAHSLLSSLSEKIFVCSRALSHLEKNQKTKRE